MRLSTVLGSSLFSLALACGDSGSATDASTDASTDAPASDAPNDVSASDAGDAAATPVSLTMGPFVLGAGVESTKCVTLPLTNASAMHVGSIHTVLTGSWRDLVVYRVDDKTPSPPADCAPLHAMATAGMGTALQFTQRDDEQLQLPAGAGFTFADHQMIRLELHGRDDGTGFGATVTFEPMADSAFKQEAGMVLVGLLDITVPVAQVTQLHQQAVAPPITLGAQLLVMAGHQHELGTELTAGLSVDGGAPSSLYDNTSWNAPTIATLAPPPTVTGGTKLDVTCTWNNQTNQPRSFGMSSTNEQCFVRAHYAPATGSELCFHTASSGGLDVCCPGGPVCNSL